MERRKPVVKLVSVNDATSPADEDSGRSAAEEEDAAASKLQAAARGRQARRQRKHDADSKAQSPNRAICSLRDAIHSHTDPCCPTVRLLQQVRP
jgi:hypothetical protein